MGRYLPHETSSELMSHRELALARRHSGDHEQWNDHTKRLTQLKVGDHVYIQNLIGNHTRRWERTGIVVEVRQYHQYVIRVDGRVTIRNRQHLRKFTSFHNPVIPGSLVTPIVAPDDAVTGNPSPSTQPQMSRPASQSPMLGIPTGVDLNKLSSPLYPAGTPPTTKAEHRTIGRFSMPGTRMGTLVIARVPHDQVETVTKDTTQKDRQQTVLEPKTPGF